MPTFQDGRVAGLSKLARTVERLLKKSQNSERLNIQVADALMEYLGAKGASCYHQGRTYV